jgi:hypothetical protein
MFLLMFCSLASQMQHEVQETQPQASSSTAVHGVLMERPLSAWGQQRLAWECSRGDANMSIEFKAEYEIICLKLDGVDALLAKDELMSEAELGFIKNYHYMFSDAQLMSICNIVPRGSTAVLKCTARESAMIAKLISARFGLSFRDVLLECGMLDGGVHKCFAPTSAKCAREKVCTISRRVGCVTCARHKDAQSTMACMQTLCNNS